MMKHILILIFFQLSVFGFSQEQKHFLEQADTYFENNEYTSAIEYYKKYLKTESDNYVVYISLGICYDNTKDYHKAIESYNNAISLKPHLHYAYFCRAFSRYFLGDNEGACSDICTAIEYGSEDAKDYINKICSNEEQDYKALPNCSNLSDLKKWITFVEKYPNSSYINEEFIQRFEMYYYHIYNKIIDNWENINQYDDAVFTDYRKFFPNGKYSNQMNGENVKTAIMSKNNLFFDNYKDPRDNNEYKTISYRGKTMFAENLRYKMSGSKSVNDNTEYDLTYGRYYTYAQACKACPDGWELLDISEKQTSDLVVEYWKYLVKNDLFWNVLCGRYIKSKAGNYFYTFSEVKSSQTGHWWIESRNLNLEKDKALSFYFLYTSMQLAPFPKESRGFSVRCVKK